MLGNYSKFYGAIVGGAVSYLVAKGLLPADFNTPDVVAALTTIVTSIFVWAFPANRV